MSEIISHQPLKKENISQVEILKRQEEFISNYFNNKKNLKADAMHLLGDLYRKMERNNLLAISLDPDRQRSAEIYEKILSLYPDRPENESILYQLSSVYCEKRDIDKCTDLLFELREKYPESIYILEANFRLGEIFFDAGQFRNASTFYQESIKKEDPYFYERALYKLGLSYFNLQEYEKVIDIFLSLIDRKRVDVEYEKRFDIKALPESDRELVSDVINITILAFSYIGDPSNIDKYLEETEHKDYEIVIYKKLAEYYIKEKNIYDAISVYKNFIEFYPLHEESPLFQAKIIELYANEDFIHQANKARIRLIEDYNRESDWYKNNNANSRRKINAIVKKNLKELSLYYHSQAQASNYTEDYNNAINLYKKFLRYFPSERESSEINFLLAEALYETGEYREAAIEYEKTAYKYQTHNHAKDAAYSAIFSIKKVLDEGSIDDVEVDLYTERFIKNCERFALLFPDDSRTPDIVMKAGEILFEREDYENFRRFVSRVIDKYTDTDPSNPIIYKLQSLIADSLFKEKKYTKAEEEYRKAKVFIKTEDLNEVSEIDRLMASSIYKEAENSGKMAGQMRLLKNL
ncbi:MAG: tol-pal system YbgF family protein [Nitrospirota bacterium]